LPGTTKTARTKVIRSERRTYTNIAQGIEVNVKELQS